MREVYSAKNIASVHIWICFDRLGVACYTVLHPESIFLISDVQIRPGDHSTAHNLNLQCRYTCRSSCWIVLLTVSLLEYTACGSA